MSDENKSDGQLAYEEFTRCDVLNFNVPMTRTPPWNKLPLHFQVCWDTIAHVGSTSLLATIEQQAKRIEELEEMLQGQSRQLEYEQKRYRQLEDSIEQEVQERSLMGE